MLIIVDKKIPDEAKKRLRSFCGQLSGFLVELETTGLVYPAISGHPDIFICQTPQTLVISPNLPDRYINLLDEHKVSYVKGNLGAGTVDPDKETPRQSFNPKIKKKSENKAMTCYNAAINEHFLVHRLEFTDPVILENCHYLNKIAVRQGYTRCNLRLLKDKHYITSDQGINMTLQKAGMDGLYVKSKRVILPGFPNGFVGGTMGLLGDTVFSIGSLQYLPEGKEIIEFLYRLNYRVIELYEGPLYDGGGILFI